MDFVRRINFGKTSDAFIFIIFFFQDQGNTLNCVHQIHAIKLLNAHTPRVRSKEVFSSLFSIWVYISIVSGVRSLSTTFSSFEAFSQ